VTGYDFVECAKRMGGVLLGRTEASVTAVTLEADSLTTLMEGGIAQPLRAVYQQTVNEPVPMDFYRLLADLPEVEGHARASR
jgi:hypothetical protein